jgi:hypothetical protein
LQKLHGLKHYQESVQKKTTRVLFETQSRKCQKVAEKLLHNCFFSQFRPNIAQKLVAINLVAVLHKVFGSKSPVVLVRKT